jgi:hypothetical protein
LESSVYDNDKVEYAKQVASNIGPIVLMGTLVGTDEGNVDWLLAGVGGHLASHSMALIDDEYPVSNRFCALAVDAPCKLPGSLEQLDRVVFVATKNVTGLVTILP